MSSFPSSSSHHRVFSYGSNSLAQLRARVLSPTLSSQPATLPGYARFFAGFTEGWGGACASIHPVPPDHAEHTEHGVLGSLVELSDAELARLRTYEGGYHEEGVSARLPSGERVEAITFIKNDTTFVQPPSLAYLTATHGHLAENHPAWAASGGKIPLLCMQPFSAVAGQSILKPFGPGTWSPPPVSDLDIHSLVVRANNHALKEKKWEMPRTIHGIQEKLASIGLRSVAELSLHLSSTATDATNAALQAAGHKAFSRNTLLVLRSVLDLPFGAEAGEAISSLPRLAVLVNNHASKERKWDMPATAGQIEEKLNAIGIRSAAQLASYCRSRSLDECNAALDSAGQQPFSGNTWGILCEVLAWPGV